MPAVYYGPYGVQYETYAEPAGGNTGTRPLGHHLILPDGRVYAYALNDGTVEVAGRLYQSVASVADHFNVVADVARAIGATVISATLGATLAAVDIYSEGVAHTNDLIGESYTYSIKRARAVAEAHAAAAASAVLTVNLQAGDTVQVALDTTSEITFTRNRFHSVLLHPSPPTALLAGVSPGVAAADRYYWSQISGYAAVLADGTLLAGLPVQASITTDGAVENAKRRVRTGSTAAADSTAGVLLEDQDGNEVNVRIFTLAVDTTADISGPILINAPLVGMCVKANATGDEALINLMYLDAYGPSRA